MRTRTVVIAFTIATGLFVTGALAQHEEHQGAPADTKTGGMMAGKMMPQMMMGQNEAGKLVDQLMKSFAAIEAEKDPVALKTKLAEHGALLKELQTKVQGQAHMMEMMQHMMGEHKN